MSLMGLRFMSGVRSSLLMRPQSSSMFAGHFSRTYSGGLLPAPPLVYISGEEMTRYAGELYLHEWIRPNVDVSNWEFYDLSCRSRDDTEDKVLQDAIDAGNRICAIYKEPTITPTQTQKEEMGLKKAWGSPNGAMRRGWNGITISRDTIQVPGMQLGYQKPVLFDRHAVGGEYGAAFKLVGRGRAETKFYGEDGSEILIDSRELVDDESAVVLYSNPYDNVVQMAHHFFSRCLDAKVTPCVVTKKTVFKWQEGFWSRMKSVYDEHYRTRFADAGVSVGPNGDLQHFLSDVATMQLIRWTDGGFGMCAHNYDGDVLTDQLAQIHRSPGFLSSVLSGVNPEGNVIKEFEASHGTVTDMWHAHQRGDETSLNPLSMMEALIGAMKHSVKLEDPSAPATHPLLCFCDRLQQAIYAQMTSGKATRDLDKDGVTTEEFVRAVRERLEKAQAEARETEEVMVPLNVKPIDMERVRGLFNKLDVDQNGKIDLEEFAKGLTYLGISPKKQQSILNQEREQQNKADRER